METECLHPRRSAAWIKFVRGSNVETEECLHDRCGPEVTLVCVEIRERPLAFLHSSYGPGNNKGPMKPFKHDYIILTAMDKNNEQFSFMAEKMKDWTRCVCGLLSHIRIVRLREAASSSNIRFVWLLNQSVSTTALNRILTDSDDPYYDFFSTNCWKYATDTVEGVLNLCLDESRRTQNLELIKCFREGLLHLETMKRVSPRDGFRLLYNPFSSRNLDTLVKIFS